MDVRKDELYKSIVQQIADEFDIPKEVVFEIIESMFAGIIKTVENYAKLLLRLKEDENEMYCYIPFLGKIVTSRKSHTINQIVEEAYLPEEEFKEKLKTDRVLQIKIAGKTILLNKMKNFRKDRDKYVNDKNLL